MLLVFVSTCVYILSPQGMDTASISGKPGLLSTCSKGTFCRDPTLTGAYIFTSAYICIYIYIYTHVFTHIHCLCVLENVVLIYVFVHRSDLWSNLRWVLLTVRFVIVALFQTVLNESKTQKVPAAGLPTWTRWLPGLQD